MRKKRRRRIRTRRRRRKKSRNVDSGRTVRSRRHKSEKRAYRQSMKRDKKRKERNRMSTSNSRLQQSMSFFFPDLLWFVFKCDVLLLCIHRVVTHQDKDVTAPASVFE